ncbi:Elongation factor P--(R)-beta-lysine ligase [Gammaproteobacteria bacterium]
MSTLDWMPSASFAALRHRAEVLAKIRAFFARKNVLEVETPILSHACGTDPQTSHFVTILECADRNNLYLQTSPEFSMKRLLAAGSGSIYQICKSFRNGEVGHFHNPEFTLLEWYRVGFDHHALMDEMDELLKEVLACLTAERVTYQTLFLRHVGVDPFQITVQKLKIRAASFGISEIQNIDKEGWLDVLMTHCIAPHLGQGGKPTFVYDYPASQAALAKINPFGVAERFEVYFNGIELANGFHELQEPLEQRKRFEREQEHRQKSGLPSAVLDERFLEALKQGLPNCAGVALGIDRLVTALFGVASLAEVMAFPIGRA